MTGWGLDMPTRKDFPSHYFDNNPLEGVEPVEAYKRLQWGNEPREILEIEADEPLIALGEAAKLELSDRRLEWDEGEAHIAIGLETNRVYIFPVNTVEIPNEDNAEFSNLGEVYKTDYYSDKGNEPGYYYHEHESPYPSCLMDPISGVIILEPEITESGERSYAVSDEGIIG